MLTLEVRGLRRESRGEPVAPGVPGPPCPSGVPGPPRPAVAVSAFFLPGDAVRDALDPKLR
ncbi:hypothetical protein [Streptomyces sp. N50]|uniref:hypothetical protein n=1 Tax=Streptomyces sp. N50 TaxID=3081765 RepID=UPI00296244B1|nr:hypothetical protein [Streptomyces sp. N50]WOX12358.1 hypothetical protein R2B38_27530 [Streptomyces sp. N50]